MSDRDTRSLQRRAALDPGSAGKALAASLRQGDFLGALGALGRQLPQASAPVPSHARLDRMARRTKADTELRQWTLAALLALTALDYDRAQERNARGWSRLDGPRARAFLADAQRRGLTPLGWAAAAHMCRRYVRQLESLVGPEPAAGEADQQAATALGEHRQRQQGGA